MNLQETRQLGIEFERRIQTMIPEKEYIDKLDTDTIYSFLNQYQDKYVHEIYRNLDRLESGSKLSAHVESILQSLQDSVTISMSDDDYRSKDNTQVNIQDPSYVIVDTARSATFELPKNFYMYIRSVSNVSSTYGFRSKSTNGTSSSDQAQALQIRILPNELVSQSDVWRLLETPHDSLRILRYPAVVLSEPVKKIEDGKEISYPTLTCIYDRYTTLEGIKVLYYKQPQYFNIMTSTECELPMDAFDDLVTGAVDLYIQYLTNNRPTDRTRQPIIPASETAKAKEESQRQQRNRKKQDND